MLRSSLIVLALLAQGLLGFTQPASAYKGWRLSIHRIADLQTNKHGHAFTCNVINTGREKVSFSKNSPPVADLVFELDTVSLPSQLKGRKSDIFQALLKEKIDLGAGQTSSGVKLFVPLTAKAAAVPTPANPKEPSFQVAARDTSNRFIDYENSCPDLVFDTAYIVAKSKTSMTVRYALRNIGGATARLLGNSDEEADNLAVNVYFNRATKLTRGALLADGAFVKEGKETQNGLLFPNARLFGEITVPADRYNKFVPNIILELDPFNTIIECDKTNNTFVISTETGD